MRFFSTREGQSKTTPETVYGHIQCTPLVDVLSISIGSHLDNVGKSTLCEIYGKIRVLDTRHGCENELFSFFNKDEDNPEYVHFDEPLLLTTPSPTPVIAPSENICLDVSLYIKRANNIVDARGKIMLDKKGDECEEFHDVKIDSEEDKMIFAHVHYAIIQYAVAATIDVLFFSKDDKFDFSDDEAADAADDDNHIEEPRDFIDCADYDERDCGDGVAVDVSGTVSGHSDLKAANGNDWHPILLFKKSPSQGVKVKSGGFIELSRSDVILPAYSSALIIEVDLSYREGGIQRPIANKKKLKFQLHSEDTFKKDLLGDLGEGIRVRVTWNQSYLEEAEEARAERQEPRIPRVEPPVQWLEMFSVVLYRKDFKPFSFYGTMRVLAGLGEHLIFSKDKKHPQTTEAGAMATLKDARFHSLKVEGHYLAIVDFRDAETGDTISLGTVQWDEMVIEPWLDMRLCSIVRGEQGFAAVHCNAFYDGICAFLHIKLEGKHLPGYVNGKIVARDSTYEYSTAYDKKYYQITLFDNESGDYGSQQAVEAGRSCLPLLKSSVCLARGSSLIVEVNLRVFSKRPSDGNSHQGAECLQGRVLLNPDIKSPQRLRCETYSIDVYANWRVR